jgi:hypothetical protein
MLTDYADDADISGVAKELYATVALLQLIDEQVLCCEEMVKRKCELALFQRGGGAVR